MEKSETAEEFTCQIRVAPFLKTNKQNQSEITFTARVLAQFSSQFFWECDKEFGGLQIKRKIDGEEELNLTEEVGQVDSLTNSNFVSQTLTRKTLSKITPRAKALLRKILPSPLEKVYFNMQLSGPYIAHTTLHEYCDY